MLRCLPNFGSLAIHPFRPGPNGQKCLSVFCFGQKVTIGVLGADVWPRVPIPSIAQGTIQPQKQSSIHWVCFLALYALIDYGNAQSAIVLKDLVEAGIFLPRGSRQWWERAMSLHFLFSEVRTVTASCAGMISALFLYCLLLPPGVLLAQCGESALGVSNFSVHSVAIVGMSLGAGLMQLWAPGQSLRQAASVLLAALGMTLFHQDPAPEAFLFSPAFAAIAIGLSMVPGMVAGHFVGWLLPVRTVSSVGDLLSKGVYR